MSERKCLYLAAEYHRYKILQHLTKLGVDVNSTNGNGDTALHILASAPETWKGENTRKSVRALLEAGARLEAKDGLGRNPIQVARDANHHHTTRYIIQEMVRYVIRLTCYTEQKVYDIKLTNKSTYSVFLYHLL